MTVILVWKRCQLLISELQDATAHGTDLQLAMGRPWSRRALAMIPEVPVGALMTPQTFSSYLRSQSTAIRGILGHGLDKYSDTALTTFATSLSSCEGISIFGDGSVKDGRGAHATQIYASSTFLLKTSAVTSGDPSTITYLRGETSSKLSGLYILFLIQTHFFNIPLTAPVTFYYDNKESL